MKRTDWIYRSGDIWLPAPVVEVLDRYIVGDKTTLFYLNGWHINHFFSGVFFACLVFWFRIPSPLLTYIVVHTLWELWQIAIGMTPLTLRGMLDILVDTGVGILGYTLTASLIRKQ